MIPSAIELFNKQTIQKKQNLRNFIGLKTQYKDCSAGLYGIDFCEAEYVSATIDKSEYVACLEKNCSFKGPLSMMDLHTRTVHDMGLDKEINVDNETWRDNRKKKFPTLNKIKEKLESVENVTTIININKPNIKNRHKNNKKRKSVYQPEVNEKEDPLNMMLSKKMKEIPNEDILGLGAVYPCSDNEEETVLDKPEVGASYLGLPLPEELSQQHLRRNKYRFPILPHMELNDKRNKMMNPERRYMENNNTKKKRPRLAEMLFASELSSDRNCVLQCVRYLCNKRFFDPMLQNIAIVSDIESMTTSKVSPDELDADIFKMEEAKSDDDSVVWSDEEL